MFEGICHKKSESKNRHKALSVELYGFGWLYLGNEEAGHDERKHGDDKRKKIYA